jgi:hypothetical protein
MDQVRISTGLVKDKRIVPTIPVIDKSKREDGTFSREDFTFDKARNSMSVQQDDRQTQGFTSEEIFGKSPSFGADDCQSDPILPAYYGPLSTAVFRRILRSIAGKSSGITPRAPDLLRGK